MLNLASWSVVNATHGDVVATAPLEGITQTIDRAELTALLRALQWLHNTELSACIWSDSLSTVQVANYIQRTGTIPEGVANLDVWTEVHAMLHHRPPDRTHIRWIPSHLPPSAGEDPFEDWLIHWNDRADALALHTNRRRRHDLWRTYCSIVSILDGWTSRLRQLRQFFFAIADHKASDDSRAVDPHCSESDEDHDWLWLPWLESLPVNWQVQVQHGTHRLPGAFLVNLVNWVGAAEHLEGSVRDVSDVEFVCLLLLDRGFSFPFSLDGSLKLCMRCPDQLFQRPTFAAILRPLEQALAHLHSLFPHVIIRTQPLPRPSLGLYMPFRGVRLQLPDTLWYEARSKLSGFVANRALRRSCDLARPAPA